ncbi:collagenase 3-like [Mytilus trossulus]|uniref:collagenase 3-like n=1 Tax=Mytilus trossulus TaxID=6551 RepID=UPI003004A085
MRFCHCLIFCFIYSFSNGNSVHRETRQTGEFNLDEYLQKFGYMEKQNVTERTQGTFGSAPSSAVALRAFQGWNSLPVTGTLDDTTMELIRRPRCGFPDPKIPMGEVKPFVLGPKWNKKSLTYRITSTTTDLSSAPARSELARAFKFWTDVADIEITETSNSNSDIVISFETGDHNDGSPFDGAGGVLAHAFFPTGGVCHFDEGETWVINGTGIDLFTVGAHEIGHLLGLDHSNDRAALMFPFYGGFVADYTIPADDRAAIVAHYGARTTSDGVTESNAVTQNAMITESTNDMVTTDSTSSASQVISGNHITSLIMITILYHFDVFNIS